MGETVEIEKKCVKYKVAKREIEVEKDGRRYRDREKEGK